MAEIEDGEILDSDEETPTTFGATKASFTTRQEEKPKEKHPAWSLQHRVSVDEASRSSYRSSTPHEIGSGSEDSLESDEDSDLWKGKQAKYFRGKRSKTMETDDCVLQSSGGSKPVEKKQNNIWGSVIQEQDLTATLRSVDVEQKSTSYKSERSVESYDFTNKYRDTRPDLDESEIPQIQSNDPFDQVLQANTGRSIIDYEDTIDKKLQSNNNKKNRKRKSDSMAVQESIVSNRIGKRRLTTRLGAVKVTQDNTEKEVVQAIVDVLNEPNIEMIERVVQRLGKEFALRILHQTRDVEASGGMMINNGSRRRTPGGVYIQIMKSDPECTSQHKKVIFADNEFSLASKNKKRYRNKKKGKTTVQRRSATDDTTEVMEDDDVREGDSEMFGDMFKEQGETGASDFMSELAETKKQILQSKLNSQTKSDSQMGLSESHVCRNPENGEDMLEKSRLETESYDGMNDLDQEEANVIDVPIGDF